MYQFAAEQQTSTAKLLALFERFQTEERVLRVNKTKSSDENAFNGSNLGTEGNHESSNDEKVLFWVFLQICNLCFNPLTAEDVYLRFSGIL